MSSHVSMERVVRHWRLGALGVALAALCATSLLWQSATEAGATPFEPQVAAVQKDRQLQVAVALAKEKASKLNGTLGIELIGATGQTLDDARKELRDAEPLTSHRFNLETPSGPTDRLFLRVSFAGRKSEIALGKVMLAKGHETTLSGGQQLHAGGPASLTCSVNGIRSITESLPLAGSEVIVRLRDKAGKSHEVYKGRTGAGGMADVQFEVPDLAAGQYTMEVITRSVLGEEKIEREVRIASDTKILLVSDKPIYQPGQLIHLRALVLRPFDMRPIADKDLLFEVEDPKGNKVFKRTFKTSEYGVAAVDFQLADEVNMGGYHIRAVMGDARTEKTVEVKRYVLPKFKVDVKADKTFYLPKETVKVNLQSDYFFGKPVAGAKVEVLASTFDVAFNKFHTWKGETDANGHAKLEITLPDHFVGQPIQNGNGLVKLDVKVLDTADHAEVVTKTYPVSDQAVRISLISEGGRIVPDMENRVFVATTYPDGSPAPNTEIKLWHEKIANQGPGFPGGPFPGGGVRPGGGPRLAPDPPPKLAQPPAQKQPDPKAEPLAVVKTNAAGLAEFKIKPKADQLRTGNWGMQDIEMLGGKQQRWGPQILFDIRAGAKDAKGNTASTVVALNSHPMGENVLLRLDKAIYQAGDRLGIDIRTSAGMPTVYVDIVRGGQIMLSKWLEVKDGKASQTLDLPQSVFGSLEIHAYQMLQHGEIIRDSRVVYVQPRNDLKVTVQAKAEYAPGENGMIRFLVTDAKGKPTPAAIGIVVVDEAVYALQDMQPGLEKVYFTLQEELLKPQVQIKMSPGDTIGNLVIQPVLPAPRQQVAEVLLTAVKLPPPKRFVVDPAQDRKNHVQAQVQQIGQSIWHYAWNTKTDPIAFDKASGRWSFRADLLDEAIKANFLPGGALNSPFGGKLALADLGRLDPDFTPDNLARALTAQRIHDIAHQVANYTNQRKANYFYQNEWVLGSDLIAKVIKEHKLDPKMGQDAWGQPLRIVMLSKKQPNPIGHSQFDQYEIVSSGPDRKLSNADDVRMRDVIGLVQNGWVANSWWMSAERRAAMATPVFAFDRLGDARRDLLMRAAEGRGGFPPPGALAPMAAGGAGGFPQAKNAVEKVAKTDGAPTGPQQSAGGGAEAPRVREFFPETMLWQPALITDAKGEANLAVSFADSITTWRLSASANSKGGALGNATLPLKVFQDFFVDIDLPVSLTQGDEIAFPVAVYNYLKTPQTVKIELEKEPWFELLDQGGLTRSLDIQPNEVTSVKFRIKANKIGYQPLTVKAFGTKKSDAVKRSVDVVPNGQKIEKVATDRLKGKVTQVIDIPADSVPDASKLIVRIYPGVMAQVLEGVEGLIRLPGG